MTEIIRQVREIEVDVDQFARQITVERYSGERGPQGPQGVPGPAGNDGSPGPAGPAGTNGIDGIDGTMIWFGEGDPTPSIGLDNDFYINLLTHYLFGPKSSNTWPTGISLVSPAGPKGDTGDTGATGAAGPKGDTGDTGPEGPSKPYQPMATVPGVLAVADGELRLYNRTGSTLTINEVFICVNTAPVGSAIIVDIHKNETTIFTNQAHRPQIAAGEYTGYTTTIDVSSWANGDYLKVNVDAIGSGTPGSNLTVHIVCN